MKLPRPKSVYLLAVLIVCLLGILIYLNLRFGSCCAFFESRLPTSPSTMTDQIQNQIVGPAIKIRDVMISVELATTSLAIRKGLSGRESLAPNQGMLFVFDRPDHYRFWMPEMNFPLDIIWLEEDRVAGFEQNASNDFDPAQPVFYQAPVPVRLVLEVNAGFVAKHKLKVGDPVDLSYLEK